MTTVVIGNCGFTIAPCRAARSRPHRAQSHPRRGHVARGAARRHRWDFESYPRYLDVAGAPRHGAQRRLVRRPLLGAHLRAGRRGHQARRHRGRGRARCGASCWRPCAPAPSASPPPRSSSTTARTACRCPRDWPTSASCIALTGALGEAGRGVFMLTKGMTSTIPWLEKIAAANGRPVMIAAMFVDPGDPTRVFQRARARSSAARERGRELWAQVGCFPLGMEFTLRHPYPLEAFLALAAGHRGRRRGALPRVLADPSFRAALKDGMRAAPACPTASATRPGPPDHHRGAARPEHRDLEGQTIGELARATGRDPFDVFLDFGLDGELDAMFDCRLFNTDENEVRKLLRHPERRGRALRRRRAPVVPLRCRLRPAPVRPLGARSRRPDARAGGAARDQRRRPRPIASRTVAAWPPARGPT